jgi:2'-5' RNA ligase
MKRIRTFVAVELSAAIIGRAADLVERLQRCDARVKWVDPANMHLTLKFLGDVPESEIASVCHAVTEAAASHEPFTISAVGAGAFPDARRPRTLWIGIERGADQLCKLQKSVDRALREIGFPKEGRQFHPHLTIGRLRQGGPPASEMGELVRELGSFDAGTAKIDQVVVFASYLSKAGPTYEALGRARLSSG